MIFFFRRGLSEFGPESLPAGKKALAMIEGLGGDLAGMIDSHERATLRGLMG